MKLFFIWLFWAIYLSQITILVLGCIFETIEEKSTIIFLAIPFGFIGWVIKYYKELED